MNQVIHSIHRVGIRHSVLRSTAARHTSTTVHRRCVRSIPCTVLSEVVAKSHLVHIVDVPVYASEQLIVAFVGREVRERTCIVAILALQVVRHLLKIGNRGARDVVIGIGNTIFRSSPAVGDSRSLVHFTVNEEEQLILDNRATQLKSVSSLAVLGTSAADLFAVDSVTTHIFISVVDICSTLESVGTRHSDSVYTTTDEVGLTYVVWRNYHLHFFDCFDRDRVTTTGQVTRKTEVVVEVCTVNSEVGSTAISTTESHTITTIRRQTSVVGYTTADRRHCSDLTIGDVGRCTGLFGSELSGLCSYHYIGQLHCIFRHRCVQVIGFTQFKCYACKGLGFITNVLYCHFIRAAYTHTIDGKHTFLVRHCCVTSSGRRVNSFNYCTN